MTQRLLALIGQDWARFDGSRIDDPLEMPIDRFLSTIYSYWIRENQLERTAIMNLDRILWMPPAGVIPIAGPWTAEAEAAAFSAVKAQLGGRSKG